MPFGVYEAKVRSGQGAARNLSNQNKVQQMPDSYNRSISLMTLNIRVVGRSVAAAVDLVAGILENANPVLGTAGLSLYCPYNSMLTELLNRQKGIKSYFNSVVVGGNYNPFFIGSDDSQSTSFTMQISRSGVQNVALTLNFYCTTPAMNDTPPCEAVWAMADAPLYQTDRADSYAGGALACASQAVSENRVVYLILSQFEHCGSVRNSNNICTVDDFLYRDLNDRIRARFGGRLPAGRVPAIPVQIYGGLAFREQSALDGNSVPLYPNSAGGLIAYKPEGCHIPMLMTISQLNPTANDPNGIIGDICQLNGKQIGEMQRVGVLFGG